MCFFGILLFSAKYEFTCSLTEVSDNKALARTSTTTGTDDRSSWRNSARRLFMKSDERNCKTTIHSVSFSILAKIICQHKGCSCAVFNPNAFSFVLPCSYVLVPSSHIYIPLAVYIQKYSGNLNTNPPAFQPNWSHPTNDLTNANVKKWIRE